MNEQNAAARGEYAPLLAAAPSPEDSEFTVEFNREVGYSYLCLLPSIVLPCLYPLFSVCARKHIDSQRCTVTDRRVVFESGWLDHSSKNIPLDRIQDVNVRQDCIQKWLGLRTVEIQTAGMGGAAMDPEARLIAPTDAFMVRDVIMDRRDALVLGHPQAIAEGVRHTTPLHHDVTPPCTYASNGIADELRSIKETLSRLEVQVTAGVQHLTQ